MKTKIFRVKGKLLDIDKTKPFTRELKATKEEDVKEQLLSEFGSKHRLNRSQIIFDDISEITADEVTDPVVRDLI
ncbi:50S ribosomal protein L18Ae [Candidatus Methanosphaera massiliense]|uniref:50S ribosomal protein L18Ae n=1 Tax=Candidatus Methanosphaera massiliense TaxID=3017187 RepID=UPI000DC5D74A|nr:50S ribosomal protein L18Ae [Candidatus Methanosphaera massiliense]MDD6286493.1 50S ribosomal protein L18Ae [Methanobacteriaceae archaeon]MDE4078863.1 50S ribosomal protein L18Ae [Candidatus Methanosphaera massiliense]MDY2745326.1 50S ribosomal protein L18Ae [Methanosphaera sp.]RAP45246.1 MAG: 50S ribosomal protein L18a [Methanosphaera sp. SHI1033]